MVKEKSFEEQINELEEIVNELEKGEVSLDDAINKYTNAMKIAKICSEKLKNAENQISKIVKENGTLEDFEIE
jgi:exodeoxyribonuclease VII small subunit